MEKTGKILHKFPRVVQHTHHAIRYGVWDCGWDDRPKNKRNSCGVHHIKYDGDHVSLTIGRFYISVSY